MAKIARLSLVRNERNRKRSKTLRSGFYREARAAFHEFGDEIGGFALVIWDQRGRAAASLEGGTSQVSGSQVPVFVQNVLTQTLGSMLVDTPPAPQDDSAG